jgi:hypothetical protein
MGLLESGISAHLIAAALRRDGCTHAVAQSLREIINRAAEGGEVRVVGFGDVDAEPFVHGGYSSRKLCIAPSPKLASVVWVSLPRKR